MQYNLFAYCTNNVILYSDPTGYFKDIIDSVKTILDIAKNPATNQVLKSTSNIVKGIAKSEFETAVVFEVSSGYGYGVTTDFGGLKVGLEFDESNLFYHGYRAVFK